MRAMQLAPKDQSAPLPGRLTLNTHSSYLK